MDETTLYVDVENLQGIAKEAILSAIEHWPTGFPPAKRLKLYVEADKTELWKIWASHHVPSVETTVKGVQHYTMNGSKNSADISLALDALADLLKSRTKYVAIMSDDSDYATLFSVMKQEAGLTENSKVPFKWFMTDRLDTRSTVLSDFFPSEYVHTTACSPGSLPSRQDVHEVSLADGARDENEEIARFIIKNVSIGPFKSADCKKLIAKQFPKIPLGKLDSASFGTQFSKLIWPFLKELGVQLPNPKRKPRKYEMTEQAKEKVREL